MKQTFKVIKDGLQDRFLKSRAKIQCYAGGFANGKTSAAVIKALEMAKDYPGSNGLMARSTYPKLNDTLRKEFLKWCPPHWIKSFPMSVNASNTCVLTNGTEINFRYVAQQGKNNEATTPNLLSATYDWIIVDQIEDPQIVYKDFLDLLGRLRGSAPYIGEDKTMPKTGPRFLIFTTNPTANWVYRKVIKPVHDLNRGLFNPDLLCQTDDDARPIMVEGRPVPIIEIFEGSTYENRENLEPDYLKTLESSYRGQMRDRFLLGKWASYEGLVYGEFDMEKHVIPQAVVESYFWKLLNMGVDVEILEGYDFGIAAPSCHLFGFCDMGGNVFLMDGFYEAEKTIEWQAAQMNKVYDYYGGCRAEKVLSDPDVFRRKSGGKKVVGRTIADMFKDEDILLDRGNNDIMNGIVKVNQYLYSQRVHTNPITHDTGAPYMYVSDKLDFFINEITAYFWNKNTDGENIDKPQVKNDHSMDALRYMLSHRPSISRLLIKLPQRNIVGLHRWAEVDRSERLAGHRYG